MTTVMIDPMLYAYTLAYAYSGSETSPLSDEIIATIADYISNCSNTISLEELEELASEEEEEDA